MGTLAVAPCNCQYGTTIAYSDGYGGTVALTMPPDHLATFLLGVGAGALALWWLTNRDG
jgi:hypothetical protein